VPLAHVNTSQEGGRALGGLGMWPARRGERGAAGRDQIGEREGEMEIAEGKLNGENRGQIWEPRSYK